jgi:hypothetical protein
LVEVFATFENRLERLQDRDREGEGSFTAEDLENRDERELDDLGVRDLTHSGDFVDFMLQNNNHKIAEERLHDLTRWGTDIDLPDRFYKGGRYSEVEDNGAFNPFHGLLSDAKN